MTRAFKILSILMFVAACLMGCGKDLGERKDIYPTTDTLVVNQAVQERITDSRFEQAAPEKLTIKEEFNISFNPFEIFEGEWDTISFLLKILKVIIITIAILLAAYLLYVVIPLISVDGFGEFWSSLRQNISQLGILEALRLLMRKRKEMTKDAESKDTVGQEAGQKPIDIDGEIERAKAAKDWRMVTTLTYIRTMRALGKAGIVRLDASRTPTEYFAEFRSEVEDSHYMMTFRRLTNTFLKADYDDEPMSETDCEIAISAGKELETLSGRLSDSKKKGAATMIAIVAMATMGLTSCTNGPNADNIIIYKSVWDNGYGFQDRRAYIVIKNQYTDYKTYDYDPDSLYSQDFKRDVLLQSLQPNTLQLTEGLLAWRMSHSMHTLVATETFATTKGFLWKDSTERRDIIEGEGFTIRKFADNNPSRLDTIRWCGESESVVDWWTMPVTMLTDTIDMGAMQKLRNQIERDSQGEEISGIEVLARSSRGVVACKISSASGGTLLVCSVPLLYTDFGFMIDKGRNAYLGMKLLYEARMRNDLVRMSYMKEHDKTDFDEKYICEGLTEMQVQKIPEQYGGKTFRDRLFSLDSLIVLSLLAYLIFCRRTSRAIPIVEAPRNRTKDFIRHVASLYEHEIRQEEKDGERKTIVGLTETSIVILSEEIRRYTSVDVTAETEQEAVRAIVSSTGVAKEDVAKGVHEIVRYKNGKNHYDYEALRNVRRLSIILNKKKK